MGKAYVCNRFPELVIGNDYIHFRRGLFVAESPDQEKMVESNGWYGVHIHDRDVVEPASLPPSQNVRQGMKGTAVSEFDCPVHGMVPANADGICSKCFPPKEAGAEA